MPGSLRIGQPEIEILLRRSLRARRMTLRLSNSTGLATLTLPRRVGLEEARAFVERQTDWLRRQIEKQPPKSQIGVGLTVPFRGEPIGIAATPKRKPQLQDGLLLIPGDPEQAGRRVLGWLKAQARIDLTTASQVHAARLGRSFTAITLRDTRSRWGSCSSDGALMYSWRLIMAPADVLDYVAAHEVAHLKFMDHSPDFWSVVARLKPDFAVHRAWLRKHGAALHAFDFDPA